MNLLLMCDGQVGAEIYHWLATEYLDDLGAVVTTSENSIYSSARNANVPVVVFESEGQLATAFSSLPRFDLGVLAWWPKIVSPSITSLANAGFINTHPSMLPYNRGKHYNFWALVEQSPFGVTLHCVDAAVDAGDVVIQRSIDYGWEDTGETLYKRAAVEMVALFKDTYPSLRSGSIPRTPQDLGKGSHHYAREIDVASRIDLDKTYAARDLLNLLRARTFSGHPACWFEEDGATYEVRVNIKRKFS